jgi:hypothetical protein
VSFDCRNRTLIGSRVGQFAIEIQIVHMQRQANLPHVVQTGNPFAFGLGLCERRKQHRGQNCDDGDDNEQLDQGKPSKRT